MTRIMSVTVEFTAGDGQATREPGKLRLFTPTERVLRTLVVLLIAIGAAAMVIPIPIVHLVGIPLILLMGLVVAGRQAMAVARLAPMRVACPRCGAENSLGGGIGYRTTTGPIARACESCRRPLELGFVPARQ